MQLVSLPIPYKHIELSCATDFLSGKGSCLKYRCFNASSAGMRKIGSDQRKERPAESRQRERRLNDEQSRWGGRTPNLVLHLYFYRHFVTCSKVRVSLFIVADHNKACGRVDRMHRLEYLPLPIDHAMPHDYAHGQTKDKHGVRRK